MISVTLLFARKRTLVGNLCHRERDIQFPAPRMVQIQEKRPRNKTFIKSIYLTTVHNDMPTTGRLLTSIESNHALDRTARGDFAFVLNRASDPSIDDLSFILSFIS